MLLLKRNFLLSALFVSLIVLVIGTIIMSINLVYAVQDMNRTLGEYREQKDHLQRHKNELSAEISFKTSPLYLKKIQNKRYPNYTLVQQNTLMRNIPFLDDNASVVLPQEN